MNSFFKLNIVAIISLISIHNSYAEPACYMQMRSLNLAVKSDTKRVCEQEKLDSQVTKIGDEKIKENSEKSSVGMEAYFVYPHIENEEEEPTADGVGASVSVDF